MKKKTLIWLVLLFTLTMIGCGKNSAKITITCIGDPIYAGVGSASSFIYSGESKTWTKEWDKGLFSEESQKYTLYAEDYEYPNWNNSTKTVTLYDGEHEYWSIGWTEYLRINPIEEKKTMILGKKDIITKSLNQKE